MANEVDKSAPDNNYYGPFLHHLDPHTRKIAKTLLYYIYASNKGNYTYLYVTFCYYISFRHFISLS